MKNLLVSVLFSFGVLIGGIPLAVVTAFPVTLLWNWIMPTIFGLAKINVFQALGLYFLSHMFFKNSSTSK